MEIEKETPGVIGHLWDKFVPRWLYWWDKFVPHVAAQKSFALMIAMLTVVSFASELRLECLTY